MLIITCPFCGPRSENEYIHGGPTRHRRPENASGYTDAEWVEYLTVPVNPVGPVSEKWWHVRGCGEWVVIERDTLTHDITPSPDKQDRQASKHQAEQVSNQLSDDKHAS